MADSYQYFKIASLFDLVKGKRLVKEVMAPGDIPFIGAISVNNGVRNYIDDGVVNEPNCITVNYNGSVGESFYQSEPFIASDDVNILYAKSWWTLNKYTALYICTVLKHNRSRFDYGRKWKTERMLETELLLPTDSTGRPDWQYMDDYTRSLEKDVTFKPISTKQWQPKKVDTTGWKEFNFSDLFDIKGSSVVNVVELQTTYADGDYPYITRTEKNNGISGYYDYKTAPANVLTIETTLSGLCFYHEYEFSTGDHIAIIKPLVYDMNKYTAMFIKTMWRKSSYKYGYGRPAIIENIKKTILLLPVTSSGQPDWAYMEQYIKSLPYAEYI